MPIRLWSTVVSQLQIPECSRVLACGRTRSDGAATMVAIAMGVSEVYLSACR